MNVERTYLADKFQQVIEKEEEWSVDYAKGFALGFVYGLSEIECLWYYDQDFDSCVFEEDSFVFVG